MRTTATASAPAHHSAASEFVADPLPRRQRSLRLSSLLALLPTAGIVTVAFFVFVGWTVVISFSSSRLLPSYEFTGWLQYRRLFSSERWWTSMQNLAVYAAVLISGCICLGLLLAVLIDRVKTQRLYRTLVMLPLSMSFVTTGLIWQWLLNPAIGIEHQVRAAGWTDFTFDWLVRSDRAIYTIALAGIWQQTGMCLSLFLAGLRSVDGAYWRAARIDGIPTWRTYLHIVLPQLRPVFFTAFILLFAVAAKSYDLVVTLTDGGPGFASDLPARFVVDQRARNELGLGAAGACVLLLTVAVTVGPYVFMEIRRQQKA